MWPKTDFDQMADLLVEAEAHQLAGGMPKVRLKEMRQSLGFKPSRESLLVCPQLRPHIDWPAMVRYDWVHTFCNGGVLSTALFQLVNVAERMGVATQNDIKLFLQERWLVPKHRASHRHRLPDLFSEHWAQANRDGETIRCQSSELLELYSLLRYWALTRLPRSEELAAPLQQYLKVSKCIDLILKAKRQQMTTVEASTALRECLQDWLATHKAAFGTQFVKPKSHWAFDVADQLAIDSVVVDTFVIERLHLRVRAAAEHCKKLNSYETSVLARVVNEQVRALHQGFGGPRVLGRHAPFPGMPAANVADTLELDGVHVSVGDMVRRGQDVAKVVACAEEDGALFAVVDLQVVAHTCSPRSSTWTPRGVRSVWPAGDIAEVIAWKDLGEGRTLVVIE